MSYFFKHIRKIVLIWGLVFLAIPTLMTFRPTNWQAGLLVLLIWSYLPNLIYYIFTWRSSSTLVKIIPGIAILGYQFYILFAYIFTSKGTETYLFWQTPLFIYLLLLWSFLIAHCLKFFIADKRTNNI